MIVLCIILVILSLCPTSLNIYAEFGTWTLPKDVKSSYDTHSKLEFGCGILLGLLALGIGLVISMLTSILIIALLILASLILDFISSIIYIESVLNSLGHGTNSQTQVPNISVKQILDVLGRLIKVV